MGKIKITDTILRDAHQSLIATRMRTRDMLPIIERLDIVGYHSLEVWGGATFDSCIRFLNEDPWERLRELKKRFVHTPLQMLLRGQNLVGYKHYADDVVERFIVKTIDNGIDIFRIFDALNDVRNMEFAIKIVTREGAHAQGAISYTLSPVHSIEHFTKKAKDLAQLGCDSICIKDMAGLISPHEARDLVTAIKLETGLPVDLHCHCTSGVAPMSYYAAAEAGVTILDTAISPFGWGTSQPPTESIVAAFQDTEFDTELDLELLTDIKRYFEKLRDKYGSLRDPIVERIDTSILLHQIPGGMLSNLVSQLKQQNALNRYDDVLHEIPRVRAEMGYPPLVTPTSQIVGTQAVFNILSGERYKLVSQEVRDYFKGLYGRPPGPIDETIRKIVAGEEPLIDCRPADLIPPQMEILKAEAEQLGIGKTEEDLLTYALYPAIAPKFLRGEAIEEELAQSATEQTTEPTEIIGRPSVFVVEVDGDTFNVRIMPTGQLEVASQPTTHIRKPPAHSAGLVSAPMQGLVLKLKVARGEPVQKGDVVIVLEAMKMQNNVVAHQTGFVQEIYVTEGQTVKASDALLLIGEKPHNG